MKKISIWAKRHPRSARITIFVFFVILNVLGFTTGMLLNDTGIYLPVFAIVFFICLYAAGFIAYPFKNIRGKYRMTASGYIHQKTCDFLLAGSTFLMIVYFGNHREILFRYSLPFTQAIASSSTLPATSVAKPSYKSVSAFLRSMKDENGKLLSWKERKKLLKEQVRAIKKADELSNGAKTALIVLSVLVAAGLIYLVGVIACSLACNGSEAAAWIVAIGGTGLVIFLLILAIRSILSKKKHEKGAARNKNAIIQEAPAG